jgi:hypothetical protein
MNPLRRRKISIIVLLSCAVLTATSAAYAQDLEGGAKGLNRPALGGVGGIHPSGPAKKRKAPPSDSTSGYRAVAFRRAVPTPTTGTLSVAAPSGTTIFLTDGAGLKLKGVVPQDEGIFIFDKLRPGSYHVSATRGDEYDDDETDVTIRPRAPASVTLNLPPVTYTVTFTTNVTTGEIRYAPGVERQDPVKGTVIVPTGTTSIAFIQNKQAVIRNLKPGLYGVDIVTKDINYETLSRSIKVDSDETYEVKLENNTSTGTLSANGEEFKRNWEVAPNWNAASAGLQVRGNGVAFPRNDNYRHYADFEVQSDIRIRNGVGASFVVHAKDAQNYYLVQLTGARADERYMLRGFIIKDGRRFSSFGEPQSIGLFSSTLNSSQPFTVTLRMRDKRLEVWLTDNETGQSQPAGALTDPNLVYPKGAVGIAGSDNEEFDVVSFILCKGCVK